MQYTMTHVVSALVILYTFTRSFSTCSLGSPTILHSLAIDLMPRHTSTLQDQVAFKRTATIAAYMHFTLSRRFLSRLSLSGQFNHPLSSTQNEIRTDLIRQFHQISVESNAGSNPKPSTRHSMPPTPTIRLTSSPPSQRRKVHVKQNQPKLTQRTLRSHGPLLLETLPSDDSNDPKQDIGASKTLSAPSAPSAPSASTPKGQIPDELLPRSFQGKDRQSRAYLKRKGFDLTKCHNGMFTKCSKLDHRVKLLTEGY